MSRSLSLVALCAALLAACSEPEGNPPPPPAATCSPDCAAGEICDADSKSCKTCTATEGCSGATALCDTAANGGKGACVACTATAGCSGATPVCDTAANGGAGACVTCNATGGCAPGKLCDTSVAGGQCVGCLANADCPGRVCDTTAKVCKNCLANNTGCSGATPVCDAAANAGEGKCVTCDATHGCGNTTPVCDTSSGTPTCVTCTATQGCTGGKVCDTTVAGGQCVACNSNAECAAQNKVCDMSSHTCKTCLADNSGCSGSTPLCNTSGASGAGQCVACLQTSDCGGQQCDPVTHSCKVCLDTGAGCSGSTPYCDATAGGGQGACVGCRADSDCSAGTAKKCDPVSKTCKVCLGTGSGCSGTTPVCDTTAASGAGACVQCLTNTSCTTGGKLQCDTSTSTCKTCLANNAGCTSPATCDVTANGGAGQCFECASSTDCTFDPNRPNCDTTARLCMVCLADNTGCSGTTPTCDVAANGGRGACVQCTASAQCPSTAPQCDLGTNTCKVCLTANNAGCTAPTPACDAQGAGGQGACVECVNNTTCSGSTTVCDTATRTCQTCLADNTGCSGTTAVCDKTKNGGAGQCVQCTASAQCPTTAPTCELTSNTCKTCLADNSGCSGATAKCDVTANNGAGQCVQCLGNTDCASTAPYCDATAKTCRACLADNTGCSGGTPYCDVTANGGVGACKVCTPLQGCSGATPACDSSTATGQCVQCVDHSTCLATQDCSLSTKTCIAPATPPATTSSQISAVRGTPAGAGLSLPVQGAVVTFLKPAVGASFFDPVGFFLQGEQTGPALFVGVDPATVGGGVKLGDRVNLTVTEVAALNGLPYAKAVSGVTVVNSGHNVATLVQDITAATDVVSSLGNYSAELVKVTATVADAFAASGTAHVAAQITTTGVSTASANFVLRIPETIRTTLDLTKGCVFTLGRGPMWQYNAIAQPSSYTAGDITIASCPAPTVVSAAALSNTTIKVTFDRQILASSVQINGSQFQVNNGITATAAAVSGNDVTLTVSPALTAGTSYTVTVANTVTDTRLQGVGTPNTATFTFVNLAVLLVNEIHPGMTNGADIIELVVKTGGSVKDMTVLQDPTATAGTVIGTLPDVTVAAGDIILVHMRPTSAAAGTVATANELTSKSEYPQATYSRNSDTAWDFLGANVTTTSGITFSSHVIAVKTSTGVIQDAAAFTNNSGTPPTAFGTSTQAMIDLGQWSPQCASNPCTAADATLIAAAWGTSSTQPADPVTASTLLAQRKVTGAPAVPVDTNTAADWKYANQTLGAPTAP